MTIKKDIAILRELAEKVATIADLPVQKEKKEMWRRLNDLEKVRPMIWINEIPWHEMNVDDELTLQTSDEFCRKLERELRQVIYQWEHMRGDMVIEAKIFCPLVIHDTGVGLSEQTDTVSVDGDNPIVSKHFIPQIQKEEDIQKIKMPEITYDAETTDYNYQFMQYIFSGILEVQKLGPRCRFAPWDDLVRWWGVEEVLTDLILRPEMVHQAMDRIVKAELHRLEQYEKLNLLTLNNTNLRIGTGGYGYTRELPQNDYNSSQIRPIDLWGSSRAQIFSAVSPQMHEEFSINYEVQWLKRFGLNYYGCCEPLDNKIDILKKIPNLRKISISPWASIEEAAKKINRDYVISYKPNPAIFAADVWNPVKAREMLIDALNKSKGCNIEIIMKDISTVRNKPQRLWEWAEIALEVVESISF